MSGLFTKRRTEYLEKMDDYDPCEECHIYGDDYYYDEDGDLINYCDECPFGDIDWSDDET